MLSECFASWENLPLSQSAVKSFQPFYLDNAMLIPYDTPRFLYCFLNGDGEDTAH